MKKVGKPVFFIIVLLIAAIGYLTVFGVSTTYGDVTTRVIKGVDDVRWGIDVRGGVDVTFSPPEGITASKDEMAAAESIIQVRLVSNNITDSEVYTDYDKNRIIVRFPWKADEADFNPEQAIAELGETAFLTFREDTTIDAEGNPAGAIVIEGKHVEAATAMYEQQEGKYGVELTLKADGAGLFEEATGRLRGYPISIWMDNTLISNPTVENTITGGKAYITGSFDATTAKELADKINAGALPFALVTDSYSTISPTLGQGAKDAMLFAGAIAFLLVAVIMIAAYRLPGFMAIISLTGQLVLMVASITGFFNVFPSFTLTLPGLAGIILAIGFGVDANVITSERIKEELANGRSLDAAIDSGYKRAFSAILDSNVTVIMVSIVLMGAFGPPNSLFSRLLSVVFFMFGPSAAGAIYSFGYTLLVGVVLNLLMGVLVSKLLLKSISRFSAFRNIALYGGKN